MTQANSTHSSAQVTQARTKLTVTPAETREHRLVLLQFAVLIVALIVGPFFVYPVLLMKIICFAIFASSVNLLLGYGGLLSFGQAAYFGVSGYATGYAITRLGFTPELAILTGVTVSLVLGAVFGAIAVKRLGIYFAMITLALAQIIYFLAVQNPKITGGEDGLQPIPRGKLFGLIDLADTMTLYIVCAIILLATLAFIYRVMTSPFGRVLRAIRDNEERTKTFGYSAQRYKLLALVLTSGIAGLAGSLKAIVMQVVTLTDVHLATSSEAILMMLVGGIGSLFGPILGAGVIISMQYFLAPFGAWVMVFQGLLFVACVLLFKQGIAGLIGKLFSRFN